MKILLVHPPTRRMLPSILPDEVESGRGANPPLGLLYIAAALRAGSGHNVSIIDAQAEDLDYGELERRISDAAPDVVGITALSFTMPDVMEVCAMAKRAGATTVVGGPHAHIFPDETARLENVDYILRGEGEHTLITLVDHIGRGASPDDVPGAAWCDGTVIHRGPDPAFVSDLDELPHPARDMTDVSLYTSILSLTSPITTVMTSRGCPYRCIFCDRPHMGRKFRYRSPSNVVDELEQCVKLGVREFLFYDDNFAANRDRAVAVAEEIMRRKLDIVIDARMRVTDLDYELATIFKQAGCDRVHLGVESGDPEVLERLRKGITLDDARRAFDGANRAGLRTLAYFLIGSPGETVATVTRTIELARSLKPDYVHFSLLMPFPGTELYLNGVAEGKFDGDPWRRFAENPTPGFTPPVWEDELSRGDLVEQTRRAYREFYRDPAYLWRRLKKTRSPSEMLRQARAGLRILKL